VLLGSRDIARAGEVAETLVGANRDGELSITGTTYDKAAAADVVVLATPWQALAETVRPIADLLAHKLVVSIVNPIERVDGKFVTPAVAAGSAAMSVAHWLPRSHVVAAFNNIPSMVYQQPLSQINIDVLVCAETQQSFDELVALCVGVPGVRLWNAGDLTASVVIESMTTVLLNLNTRNKTTLGLSITSLTSPQSINLTSVELTPDSATSQ
jgi:hypothetical protein